VLPTPRIAFAKQVEMIRAYGTAYVANGAPATSIQVAELVDLHEDTARLANGFFLDLGLLQRGETGFTPNADVIAFHRAKEANAENPERKLLPSFRETWFAKALTTRLAFRGALDEAEAVGILADAAGASPENKNQLSLLISYLDAAGVVERDGTSIRLAKMATALPSENLRPASVVTPEGRPDAKPLAVGKPVDQQLLEILDPNEMSEEEQSAVWILLKYLKKGNRK
jgi:hypothetical protein